MNRNYPILTQNGKLFPSWVIKNFKKYKIPKDEDVDKGLDLCHIKNEKLNLRNYQLFLSKFMDFNSPYNSILLYHGMGSGKTATAINVYNNLYNYDPNWNVFIILKASLIKSNWAGKDLKSGQLKLWLTENDYENRRNNIKFVSYDSPSADKNYQDRIKESDMQKNNLFIIDEAHNFFNNVYNNIHSESGQRAKNIYDDLLKRKREDPKTRIILITGTPIVNKPYELALMYNLLRPGTFDISEEEFNKFFIDEETQTIKPEHLNTFQRRILGLTSYYDNPDPMMFATKTIKNIDIELPEYQEIINKHFTDEEREQLIKYDSENYMTFSRISCNFAFPNANGISGDKRPKMSDFNLTDQELNDLINSGNKEIDKDKFRKEGFEKAKKNYINGFLRYVSDSEEKDKKDKKDILDDVKIIKDKVNGDFSKINNVLKEYVKSNKCSTLLKNLYSCSAKYCCICICCYFSPGPAVIYSNYVEMEGFQVMKIYLNKFGFGDYYETNKNPKYDYKRYVSFTGNESAGVRTESIDIESDKENVSGKNIMIVLISQAGAEGVSLNHVRQEHITEPHWNENRLDQVMARGIRFCSHKYLKKEDRNVIIFKYRSISKKYETADIIISRIAEKKKNINMTFLNAAKSSAVDCRLNGEVNNKWVEDKIKCFEFNENELMKPQINQAYKLNIYDDFIIDNGMNSDNSYSIDEELVEVECFIEEKEGLSDRSKMYWLNRKSGVVYDHADKYIVGSIKRDGDSFVNYEDKFIIDKLVFYPEVKN